MTNSVPPAGGSGSDATVSTTASGGASVRTRRPNVGHRGGRPSTSTIHSGGGVADLAGQPELAGQSE